MKWAFSKHVAFPSQKNPTGMGAESGGFTLVEILVSIILFSVMMLGLMAFQLTTIRMVTVSRQSGEALRLAQSRIENYRSLPFNQLPAATPSWYNPFKRDGVHTMVNVSTDGETDGPYTVWEMVEDNANGSRNISVRISWTDGSVSSTSANPSQTRDLVLSLARMP